MANLSNSMYFRFLLASIFIISVSAQCHPFNMVTTEVSSTQLSLSWRCYDPDTDDQLQVIYRLINRGQCDTGDGREDPPFDSQTTQWGTYGRNMFSANSYDQSATLFDLLPYSTYSVSVRARSPDGAGGYNPGNPVYIDPNPTTSEAAPGTFGSESISYIPYVNQLDFSWTIPCGSRNGVITGYQYILMDVNNNAITGPTTIQDTSVTITGLTCDTTYRFYVAGVNNEGTGPYSYPKTETTSCCIRGLGPVGNLQTDVSATLISLSWTAPTDRGCPPSQNTLQYVVKYMGESLQDGCTLATTDQGTLELTTQLFSAVNLTPYYEYTVSVNAVGGFIVEKEVSTPQSAPSAAPGNIMSTSTSSSLTISWDPIPCSDRNGIITGYPYQLLQGGTVNTQGDVIVTSVTIGNLTPDTTYSFRNAAKTSAGTGGWSSRAFQTMTASVTPPNSVTTTDILSTSIIFSWSGASCPVQCPGGISYAWRLYSLSASEIEVDSGITGVNDQTVTISDLTPCTSYGFRVAGVTTDGTGSFSSKTSATTAGEAPGMVIDLAKDSVNRNSIAISWEPPSSSCAPTSYTVEYSLTNRDQCEPIIDGPWEFVSTVPATSGYSTATIRDLFPHSMYTMRVHARNDDGPGLEATVTATTYITIPSAAPENVTVTFTSRNSLSFSWGEVPCGKRNSDILLYQIRLLTQGLSTVIGPKTVNSHAVTISSSLSPCTTYIFRVRAVSAQNIVSNTWSDDIEAVTAGAVDALTIVPQSATELVVSWTVPSDSCINNVEYMVEYRLTNRGQCQELGNSEIQPGMVSDSSSTLADLLPFSTYEVSVRVGMSVATELAETQGSTPTSGPNNRNAVATNSSITFTWSEPPCGQRNGIITGYTYSFIEGGSIAKRAVNVEDETTTEMAVTFTDLNIYTEYTFTIAANTDVGKGVETTMTYRTLAGVPSAPTKLKETTAADSKPVIQWSAPDMPNGEIIEYIIRYWSSDDISDLLLTDAVKGKTLMYTLPDILKTNTTYNFQVRAKTSAGVGPWSDVITVFIAPITPSGPVNQTFDPLGPIIGGVVAVILVGVVLIALICYYRRNKASTQETPKETAKDENEIYDEIDAKKEMMAKQQQQQQQRLQTLETGYEVNMAMETKMSPRAPSDGSAYEDVNIKKESEYQGLDLDAVNEEQSYQDLRGNTVGDKSAPQYANV